MSSHNNFGPNRRYMTSRDEGSDAQPLNPLQTPLEPQGHGTIWDPQAMGSGVLDFATANQPAHHAEHLFTRYDETYSMPAQLADPSVEHAMPSTENTVPFLPLNPQVLRINPSEIILDRAASDRSPGSRSSPVSLSRSPGLSGPLPTKRLYQCPICHAGRGDSLKHHASNLRSYSNLNAMPGQSSSQPPTPKYSWKSPIRFQSHMEDGHVDLFKRDDSGGFNCWFCLCSGRQTYCPANIATQPELIKHLAEKHADPSHTHRHNRHFCDALFPQADAYETSETQDHMTG